MITLPSFSFGKPFAPIEIDGCIAEFISGSKSVKNKGRKPTERYVSFDYCYNHFQSFRERRDVSSLAAKEHLAESCLHVAWYLASWGMLRGSSHLLEKSLLTSLSSPLVRRTQLERRQGRNAHAGEDRGIAQGVDKNLSAVSLFRADPITPGRLFFHFEAREIILAGAGKHFDPLVIEAFLACEDEFMDVANTEDTSTPSTGHSIAPIGAAMKVG